MHVDVHAEAASELTVRGQFRRIKESEVAQSGTEGGVRVTLAQYQTITIRPIRLIWFNS
jgi:hypothetical protein